MRPRRPTFLVLAVLASLAGTRLQAANVFWTDWKSQSTTSGFTGYGTITTPTATVDVTYHNDRGIGFYNTGQPGETDFWKSGGVRNPATSPYTSALVDNIPTGTDLIALRFAGDQTLTFSKTVANPVFSYVSLNGNGYAFLDQDFDILSFGDGRTRAAGYWGPGTSYKDVVDLGNGHFLYRLLGTGEPHGTIRFKGAFDSLKWTSLSNEYWNGFTVGIQGTAVEVFTPEPSGLLLLGIAAGLTGLRAARGRLRGKSR